MADPVSMVLVGIGGYGTFYVRAYLAEGEHRGVRLAGVVDPAPQGCPYLPELQQRQVPVFAGLEEFYAQAHADLAVIASPIHRHAEQSIRALDAGSHVLCEKPVAATVGDALAMADAARDAHRFLAVGYQWSYSDAMQAVKRDVRAGRFGRPLRLRSVVLWPRGRDYYARNDWAGRLRTRDGRWVLDSPLNNATAHYLHNMFFVLGDQRHTSARPDRLQAQTLRANAIENYDTVALRCFTEEGVELLFYASHAVPRNDGPVFAYEFEEATIHYATGVGGERGVPVVAKFRDGRTHVYGDPFARSEAKLWQAVEAVRGGDPVPCPVEAALPHTLVVNAVQEIAPIQDAPPERLRDEEGQIWVQGLEEALLSGYESHSLPGELPDGGWFAWNRQTAQRVSGAVEKTKRKARQ